MTNSETEKLVGAIAPAIKSAADHEIGWQYFKPEARAALRALHAAGYRVVPVDPTEAIRQAYYQADVGPVSHWRAMLKASPIQPEEGE